MDKSFLEIAERLRKARQQKGVSLEELQRKTKIHLNILKAIEADSLTNLNPVYLKGFIKIYCNALGLNYHDYLPEEKKPSLFAPQEKFPQDTLAKEAGLKFLPLAQGRKIKRLFFIVLGILFSFFVISKIGHYLRQRRMVSLVSENRKLTAKIQRQESSTMHKISSYPSGGINLVVSATKDKSLVYLKADGKLVFHRVLEKGRSISWKAKEKFELSLGNASAVELTVNGEHFSNFAKKRGQPLSNIIITEKDGIKIPR